MIHLYAGTRPELIKLAPLSWKLGEHWKEHHIICTGQHWGEMVDPFIIDLGLNSVRHVTRLRFGETLDQAVSSIYDSVRLYMAKERPDIAVVQGDTVTAYATASAAFHLGIPLAHVEAGLRTHDVSQPWPEEYYRVAIDRMATYHYAPTNLAYNNLINELDAKECYQTGNTIVDVVRWMLENDKLIDVEPADVLVTIHRRENHHRVAKACKMVSELVEELGVSVVWPVHPNPAVNDVVQSFKFPSSVRLANPMPYPEFLSHLSRAKLVISDSGGVAEECTIFRTPLVIYRGKTERTEAVDDGVAVLIKDEGVGQFIRNALDAPIRVLPDPKTLWTSFGRGDACDLIAHHLGVRLAQIEASGGEKCLVSL